MTLGPFDSTNTKLKRERKTRQSTKDACRFTRLGTVKEGGDANGKKHSNPFLCELIEEDEDSNGNHETKN